MISNDIAFMGINKSRSSRIIAMTRWKREKCSLLRLLGVLARDV
jgi:hypothetical protein